MKRAVPVFLFAVLIAVFIGWVPNVHAFSNFGANGTTNNCQLCHSGLFGAGDTAAHTAHAASVGGNCGVCHGGFPAQLSNCTQCHRAQGLRQHHRNAGAHTCSGCHSNPENGGSENTIPPGYAGTGLDPCDGSEELFASLTISLDNDGDLLYDGNDPDCQAAAPIISVAPTSKDYGNVTVGNSSSQVFTVSNTGTADLVISDGVLSDETNFLLDPDVGTTPCGDVPITLTQGTSCTVSIAFGPQSAGAFTATVTVTSNDTTNSPLVVDLTGNGVSGPAPNLVVTPASVDFGEVNVGDTPAVEVTLSNTGNDNLVVSNIALDNAAVYTVDTTGGSATCGSVTPTIVAGDNCTFNVIFAPAADGGPFNATVTIDSNVPSVDVPVTGTGFLDTDGDGVGDSVDDYPADNTKASPLAATGTGKILVDAGTNALSMVAAVVVADVDQTNKPSGFTFPDGLVTFRVAVAAPNDNATVNITFPSTVPTGAKYYKVDAAGFSEFSGAVFAGNTVTLSLTDGGSGDTDATADSVITDPGGMAAPVPVASSSSGGGCSIGGFGGNGGGGAVLFLTLLAILVTLRRKRARARR